jgi:uncharacterized protein
MSEQATAEQMQMPKHGEFCWTEIATNDLEKCQTFYENVFGWEIKKNDNYDAGMDYREFSNGGRGFGGMYEITREIWGEEMPPPHFMTYIAVDDVDETASQAFELGGTIAIPPTDIPNVGRFCLIKDPTGAMFSAITLTGGGEK